ILYWAVDESLLLANPLARLRLVKERPSKRPVLSVADEFELLQAASEHLQMIAIAALDTGMRRGEILNQLWEHVDLSRRVLLVTRSKTAEGESREIPLTDRLYRLLEAYQQPEGNVFTYEGRTISCFSRTWAASIRRAKIRYLRFHDLRHTFNTRLMEAGVQRDVRMALMGHSSGHSVHSRYTHVELPIKREAISKLEEWVREQIQQQLGGPV